MRPPASWLIVQVVAYEKVEEDHWPERIYVERTRSAIERAAHQFHLPDDASTLSGCIDLLQVGSPTQLWQARKSPGSANSKGAYALPSLVMSQLSLA